MFVVLRNNNKILTHNCCSVFVCDPPEKEENDKNNNKKLYMNLFSTESILEKEYFLRNNSYSPKKLTKKQPKQKIFNDGCLGSHTDEERSEVR